MDDREWTIVPGYDDYDGGQPVRYGFSVEGPASREPVTVVPRSRLDEAVRERDEARRACAAAQDWRRMLDEGIPELEAALARVRELEDALREVDAAWGAHFLAVTRGRPPYTATHDRLHDVRSRANVRARPLGEGSS